MDVIWGSLPPWSESGSGYGGYGFGRYGSGHFDGAGYGSGYGYGGYGSGGCGDGAGGYCHGVLAQVIAQKQKVLKVAFDAQALKNCIRRAIDASTVTNGPHPGFYPITETDCDSDACWCQREGLCP